MLGVSDVAFFLGIALVLLVIATSVALTSTNPVVDVADEMTAAMSPAEAEALVDRALAVIPAAQVSRVLPGTWTLSYRRHPRYSVVLGLLALPVGLLVLLFVRETLVLTVSVVPDETGTQVLVVGRAHRQLAAALGEALQPLLGPRA
jgi:hypothetical protein